MTIPDALMEKMQQAMAIIIAEHEVMRDCLVDHGLIQPGIPLKWAVGPDTGKNIVNLEEVIAKFMEQRQQFESNG